MFDVYRLLSSGCSSSARVGIGLPQARFDEAKSDLRASGCRIVLVRFGDAHSLVVALHEGTIDAAVRGTLGSNEALRELKDQFRVDEIMRTAILEDAEGRPFLLAPVGIDEGRTFDARLRLVQETLAFFRPTGWELEVGILSKGRLEDKNRGTEIKSSIEEGERMAELLSRDGHRARHYSVLAEDAVKSGGLVVAPDGVIGNLMFRTLHFVGGRNAYGAPVVNITKVFIDTSRAKSDFGDSIRLAAALFVSRTVGPA